MKVHIPVLKNRSKMTENVDGFSWEKAVWTDTDNSSSDNATLRHRKIYPLSDITFLIGFKTKSYCYGAHNHIFKRFVNVSKKRGMSWSIHVDCFKKARQPFRSCLAFLKQTRPHLRSFLIDFLAPGYALSFDVFKITLLTGRGYPPLLQNDEIPLLVWIDVSHAVSSIWFTHNFISYCR